MNEKGKTPITHKKPVIDGFFDSSSDDMASEADISEKADERQSILDPRQTNDERKHSTVSWRRNAIPVYCSATLNKQFAQPELQNQRPALHNQRGL